MKSNKTVSLALTLVALTAGACAQTVAAVPAAFPARAALSNDAVPAAVEPASTRPKSTAPVSFRQDGLWFSTSDGATHLQVHGYAQADDRMFADNIHRVGLDTFLFRRIRPIFEGTLFNAVDFRFMPDFGQNNPLNPGSLSGTEITQVRQAARGKIQRAD